MFDVTSAVPSKKGGGSPPAEFVRQISSGGRVFSAESSDTERQGEPENQNFGFSGLLSHSVAIF